MKKPVKKKEVDLDALKKKYGKTPIKAPAKTIKKALPAPKPKPKKK